MAWHQVPIYCSDCNYCVTRDAAVSQGNGTPPRRVDVLMQWVKCMSRPACKCGPATRSCCSSCMLKHFHVMSKIREVCRMDSAVLWHCAKSRFQLPYLLSYRKSTIGVSGWLFKSSCGTADSSVLPLWTEENIVLHIRLSPYCVVLS